MGTKTVKRKVQPRGNGIVLTPTERLMVRMIWKDIRGPEHGRGRAGSISALETVPELAASLESLVKQGYTLNDIGEMFGINGATVAGWLRTLGLHATGHVLGGRAWSNDHNCFVPMRNADVPSVLISHCHKGHPLTMANITLVRRLPTGYRERQCRICAKLKMRRYRAGLRRICG